MGSAGEKEERKEEEDAGKEEEEELPPIAVPRARVLGSYLPIMGNMLEIRYLGRHKVAAFNIAEWFAESGDVFSLNAPFLAGIGEKEKKVRPIFIADPAIVQELVDREDDFPKMWTSKVNQVISFLGGKGLFTSSTTDHEWHTARPLMSKPFNEVKIRQYFDIIRDKSERYVDQLSNILRDSPSKEGVTINNLNDWNSCFTFDTVMHASLGTDLGNLEALGTGKPLDPFLPAFRKAFGLNLKFSAGWQPIHYLRPLKNSRDFKEFHASVQTMFDRMTELIEQTRNGAIGSEKSVLHSLLFDTSPATKDKVALNNIPNQLVTLMVAGHETTAATMGFCMFHLANNPDCQAKALKEAREVMGEKGYLDYRDAGKLPYITACLRETLRLYSAVSLLQRESPRDAVLHGSHGKKYSVPAGSKLYVVLRGLHTRKEDWGNDPLTWDPDRFLDPELIEKRHAHSYHPFGFGVRSCVGQFFAIWEARTALALMLNKFKLEVPESYVFEPALGLGAAPFPKDLSLRLVHREDQIRRGGEPLASPPSEVAHAARGTQEGLPLTVAGDSTLSIFYGSNVGACEELAFSMAEQGAKFGLKFQVKPLDEMVEGVADQEKSTCIIITSTYNGFPPDNAKKFADWMEKKFESKGSMSGMNFALCGVGNSQWHATFHKFPKRIEHVLKEGLGAKTMMESCLLDVSKEWCDAFDDWCTKFWPVLLEHLNIETEEELIKKAVLNKGKAGNNLDVEFVAEDADVPTLQEYFEKSPEDFLARPLKIVQNRELQYNNSTRSTRHIELQLPEEMAYTTGGHLAIRPITGKIYVDRALKVLHLTGEEYVVAGLNNKHAVATLKRKRAKMQVRDLLKHLDLTVSPSQKVLEELSELAQCPPEMFKLKHLSSSAGQAEFEETVKGPGMTVLEVLQQYTSIALSIKEFVDFFPLLNKRFYSISSYPGREGSRDSTCTITVAVVEYTSGTGRHHRGLASGMLAKHEIGDVVLGHVHELSSNFHLPRDSKTPIIMVGPGTGIAPFMGFLQERRALKQYGEEIGEAVLFFGCRSKAKDFIYQKELSEFESEGALTTLHVAFSRDDPQKKVYVQHLIAKEKESMWRLLQKGASIFVCGDASTMAPDVRAAFSAVISDCGSKSKEEAEKYLENLCNNNRYLEDVWG